MGSAISIQLSRSQTQKQTHGTHLYTSSQPHNLSNRQYQRYHPQEKAQGPATEALSPRAQQVMANAATLAASETREVLLVPRCKRDVPPIPKDEAFYLPVLHAALSFCFLLRAHASCHQSQVARIAHLCPSSLNSPWLRDTCFSLSLAKSMISKTLNMPLKSQTHPPFLSGDADYLPPSH